MFNFVFFVGCSVIEKAHCKRSSPSFSTKCPLGGKHCFCKGYACFLLGLSKPENKKHQKNTTTVSLGVF